MSRRRAVRLAADLRLWTRRALASAAFLIPTPPLHPVFCGPADYVFQASKKVITCSTSTPSPLSSFPPSPTLPPTMQTPPPIRSFHSSTPPESERFTPPRRSPALPLVYPANPSRAGTWRADRLTAGTASGRWGSVRCEPEVPSVDV